MAEGSQHEEQQHEDRDRDEGGRDGRPRRPTSESLSYLLSLEPLINKTLAAVVDGRKEGDQHDDDTEDSALLVNNLIHELTYQVASLAMDRHAAPVFEKLARLSSREQLARLLQSCIGYMDCLASNRYSSHVLQTIFSLAGPMIEAELQEPPSIHDDSDSDSDNDKEDEPPILLQNAAVTVAQELQPSWLNLIYDISGTHSLRALFCLLTGMPVIAEKRGRHSKHQHNIDTAVSVVVNGGAKGAGRGPSIGWNESMHTAKLTMYQVPDTLSMILESIVVELGQLDLRALHQALCDVYAGPAICLLVQAVARSENPETYELSESGSMMSAIHKALCWSKAERCAEVFYAMAGEALSSRFLEAVLWHTNLADEVYLRCLSGRLIEFAEHEVANFVLQAWLQRTASTKQLKSAMEELEPSFKALIQNRRGGIIWRLAGASLRLHKHEKKVVKAIIAALSSADDDAAEEKEEAQEARVVRVLLGGSTSLQCNEEGRLHLNVPGARILDCLMRMPGDLGLGFCEAILSLRIESLFLTAKDNVGSRTLLDPILACAADGRGGRGGLGEKLAQNLQGKWADLAVHPVGFHILTKCFLCIGLVEKKQMAEELMAAESRLAGAHFGRRALATLSIPLLRQNRPKWEDFMAKGEKKRQVLEEIFEFLDDGGGSKGKGREKEEKRKETVKKGGVDPHMALLMGDGPNEAGGEKNKGKKKEKKEKERGDDDAEGADLGLVLDAIKASGGGIGEGGRKPEEKGERKVAKYAAKHHDKRKRREGRGGEDGGNDGEEKRSSKGGKRQHHHLSATEEKPIEKAKRLLGNRTMMTEGELLIAVGDLEQEYKKKRTKL